jgi:hypothetical protein
MGFRSNRFWAAAVGAVLAAPGLAQNEVFHNDGTTEATSRGGTATAAKVLAQRLPSDQICGATSVIELSTILQDQMNATPFTLEAKILSNAAGGPATGSPDLTAAGVIGTTGPMMIMLPGAGPIAAAQLTFTFAPPGIAVSVGNSVPAGDLYAALEFSAEPTWPADGGSCHISAGPLAVPPFACATGEQFSPTTFSPYSGVAGTMNLGWDGPVGGPAVVSSLNRSWRIATRFGDAVTQPFAGNPVAFIGPPCPGLNPNFGYAGIFPDSLRVDAGGMPIPDGLGFRLRATAPPGALGVLAISPARLAVPIVLPFGTICIDPTLAIFLFAPLAPPPAPVPGSTQKPQPATTSEALFGPFPGMAGFAGAGPIHAQGAVLTPAAPPVLTTMSTMYL